MDTFSRSEKQPVRAELWGDEIDVLSYFDTESQRRIEPINEILIFPALEIIFSDSEELVCKLEQLSASVREKIPIR